MEKTERVGGITAGIELVRRNAEVAELQPLAVAHENVEGRQVSMERLSSMQCIEGSQDCRDLTANESLRLGAVLVEPHSEIAELGVFDHEAVAHLVAVHFGEAIEDAKRPVFAREELGEVGLAKPGRQVVGNLYTHLRRESRGW